MRAFAIRAVTDRLTSIAGMIVALGVASFLTVHLSAAAFTDTVSSPDNRFEAADVRISNSHAGTAVFDASGIVPGWSLSRTVTVDNTSTVPTTVAMYVSDLEDTGLAPFLHVTVTRDGSPLYSRALTALPDSFAAAAPADEGPATTSTYVITVGLPDGQPDLNAARGTSATATFTWEARSVAP